MCVCVCVEMRRHDEGHHEERGDTATSKQHGQSDRALINKRNSQGTLQRKTHTHTHTQANLCLYTRRNTKVHTQTNTDTHTDTHTHTQTHRHTDTDTHTSSA